MRTTEPARWQELLNKVSAISAETLEKFYKQESFILFGFPVKLENKSRYCTVEGLNQQLDDFSNRHGIVYYIDESLMSMAKTAFEKTRQDHYGEHYEHLQSRG